MAEHESATQQKHEKVEQKHRVSQRDYQPLIDQSYTPDQRPFSLTETPFYPRMDEHAAVLSGIPFSAQRHEFIMRLHQTYGNSYVQRLMESMKVRAKMTVSAPNDVYEREADRVADTVTRAVNTPVVAVFSLPSVAGARPHKENLFQSRWQKCLQSPTDRNL